MLMSHDPGWSVTLKSLAVTSTDGISAIRSAVEELEARGYLKRNRERDEKGRLSHTTWEILEPVVPVDNSSSEPIGAQTAGESKEKENRGIKGIAPTCDFPTLEKPTLEKPTLDNRTLIEDQLKEELNTSLLKVPTEAPVDNQDVVGNVSASDAVDQVSASCPRWPSGVVPHSYSPATGECIDCGAHELALLTVDTGVLV